MMKTIYKLYRKYYTYFIVLFNIYFYHVCLHSGELRNQYRILVRHTVYYILLYTFNNKISSTYSIHHAVHWLPLTDYSTGRKTLLPNLFLFSFLLSSPEQFNVMKFAVNRNGGGVQISIKIPLLGGGGPYRRIKLAPGRRVTPVSPLNHAG